MKFLALVAFVAALGMVSANLQSDLHEFVALVPVEEIKAVAKKHIATDAEVQQALAYLQGPEWVKLVQTVHDHPSWQDFKAYMLAAGINVDDIIALIHNTITGAGSGKSVNVHAARGMRQFIDEIKALVPTGKFVALLSEKLQNSADFQAFWEKISSEKAHAMVEEVRALPEVQRVAKVLRDMGLDITKTLEVIYELFGWE